MKATALLIAVLLALALCPPTANAATDAEIETAIENGLAWLADQQNGDGSWGTSDQVGRTGLAVKKFEHYAVHELRMDPLDPAFPYYETVKDGLDYIFSMLATRQIGMQGANNPDSDDDTIGVYATGGLNHRTYETGIALMAIAESNNPSTEVVVANSPVNGWTYYDVAVDIMDWLAMAQDENTGGWGYAECDNGTWAMPGDRSDNSLTGYATLGLAFGQAGEPDGFGIPIPQFVNDELAIWIANIQCFTPGLPGLDYGGSGYISPCNYTNTLKTGNLLQEMKLVGQEISSDPNADLAVGYLVTHWYDANSHPGWHNDYQAMYCVMKGLEFQGVALIDGIDWYFDIADYIVATQNPDNSWGPDYRGDKVLATAWALLTLEKAAPPSEPKCDLFRIDTVRALNGQTVDVSVLLDPLEMGGFDFLIAYDASALTPLGITKGALLEDCEWEYFTYRHGVAGNCEGGCPDGLLRIIAIADLDNGPANHPSCFGPPDDDEYEVARMQFHVSSDRNLIGQCVPVRFYWADCGDNTVASITGDTTYLDKRIYGPTGNLLWDEEDDDQFPEDARPQGLGAPDECLEGAGPDKPLPLREICFQFGWICIDEPPDDRGDINMNGIANEVGDAVIFSNYFIHGDAVWDPIYQEGQILATDTNDDGIVLTIADLVYLIRIITGDEQAFPPGEHPKLSPSAASVAWTIENGDLTVGWASQTDAGAVLLAFDHEGGRFGTPELTGNAKGLRLLSHDNGAQLRVLIYGMEQGEKIVAGDGAILTVPVIERGSGLSLAEVEAADYWGNAMRFELAKSDPLPRAFALLQNIPNPFNAATRISFIVPEAGDVKLTVYDVLGRTVATVTDGHFEAGRYDLVWQARDGQGSELASGVYFYRIVTANHAASKKMVLLK